MDYSTIKIVIWDLDDTLWRGTLSEGDVTLPEAHGALIKTLSGRGVVNSICSKNDPVSVGRKLDQLGLSQYFVFPSVAWTAKGGRVTGLLADMGLRAENALFIDDNAVNRMEVEHFNPGITVRDVDAIDELIQIAPTLGKDDAALTRLEQYKILEKKQKDRAHSESNEDFLRECDIRVGIYDDCDRVADRLFELMLRTNQLNFTKNRMDRPSFDALLADPAARKGYVSVRDKYGDQGIVGFFAVRDGVAEHLLFSCRILNMGVERYVYDAIGCPRVETVPPVAGTLEGEKPDWIKPPEDDASAPAKRETASGTGLRVLVKGPCDLERSMAFLNAPGIATEFSYTDDAGRSYYYQNHVANLLLSTQYAGTELAEFLRGMPFESGAWFRTEMFSGKYDLVFLSMLPVANFAVYKHREKGFMLCLGNHKESLGNPASEAFYVNGGRLCQGFAITPAQTALFREKFEPVENYAEAYLGGQIEEILRRMPEKSRLCLILGNEVRYDPTGEKGRYIAQINRVARETARNKKRLSVIDVSDLVRGEEDTYDSPNHYTSRVYHALSERIAERIAEAGGQTREVSFVKRVFLQAELGVRYAAKKLLRLAKGDKKR